MKRTDNLKIKATHPLVSPAVLMDDLPLGTEVADFVSTSRKSVESIIRGEDRRLAVVVGPCSIHDTAAAIEYAELLQEQAEVYREELLVIMRVYFEKPRTTVGWKGLINDPELDGSFQINKGLHLARQLLIDVNKMGLPAATEFLDTTFGQYYADLISLGTVGARTTESQVHRELASGLSMPVGFKNRTDGDVQVAIDAIVAAKQPHSFPSLTKEGSPAILETTGNSDCFLILRGGSVSGPNYDRAAILHAENLMSTVPINRSIVVDCSHGNSNKDYKRQVIVVDEVCNHLRSGDLPVKGVMIESHLKEGSQKVVPGKNLEYGLSITDKCISWEKTKGILDKLANANQFKKTGSVSNTL